MRSDPPTHRAWRIVTCLVLFLLAAPASAWWNDEWTVRQKITVTVPAGASAQDVPILLRLHTGNFQFLDAQQDGRDLRVVAADDQSPLPMHVDGFDAVNELANVWVRVPTFGGDGKATFWLYYGNARASPPSNAASGLDTATVLALHFAEKDGQPRDASTFVHPVAATGVQPIANGLIDGAVRLTDGAAIRVDAGRGMQFEQGQATLTLWVKPSRLADRATLATLADAGGGLWLGFEQGRITAQRGTSVIQAASPAVLGEWIAISVTVGDQLQLFVNGTPVGATPLARMPMKAPLVLGGAGFEGDIDEFTAANVVRQAGWILTSHAAQSGSGIATVDAAESTQAGGQSYLVTLIGALTTDGWVVIGALLFMMLISVAVMVDKARLLIQTGRADAQFLDAFTAGRERMLDPAQLADAEPSFDGSALAAIWRKGLEEVARRRPSGDPGRRLGLLAIDSIRASLDTVLAEQSARLNARMVLLTISISGGPFLGLLGTVTGVMITFAAIAAAGDVNINAIAPGIAAALIATVAGLAVAIPSLFAYNWFSSRIRASTVRMETFTGELVAQLAERHAGPAGDNP